MALATFARGLRGGMPFPHYPNAQAGPISVSALAATTLDAANEVWAIVIRAPKAGNVRAVWFRPVAVTTGATLTIGAYQVDAATGTPATPPVAFATNTFITKAIVTGDAGDVISSGTFTAAAAVTKGQTFAICFINPAASFANMTFSVVADESTSGFPYHVLYTGSWAARPWQSAVPVLALEYDDGTIVVPTGCQLVGDAAGTAASNPTISNTTTPDLAGVRFRLPFPCRVTGAFVGVDADAVCNVKLVDSTWNETSTGLLATIAIDPDIRADIIFTTQWLDFDTAVTLAANTTYRLIVEPTSSTAIGYNWIPYVNQAAMEGTNLLGTNWCLTHGKTVTGDGDWTNYNNSTDGFRVPWAWGLILDGLDDGVGGLLPVGQFTTQAVMRSIFW